MTAPQATRVYRFKAEALDPITVYVEQFGPSSSRIVVQCWADAWTAYWGSHGEAGVERFICWESADYIVDGLVRGGNGKMLKTAAKREREYLARIVRAIQHHFKQTDIEGAA